MITIAAGLRLSYTFDCTGNVADVNKGFELMHAGKSIRSVVVY